MVLAQSSTNGPRSLSFTKAGTHSPLLKGSHTAAHTPKEGLFRMGALSLPSEHSARSRTSPGRVSERQTLPLLGLGREVLSKNAESLRNSDALMRVAVPQAPRPRWAALLCLQLGDVAVLSLCAQYFLNVRGGGGITTLGALCVFSKRWTTACQSGYPAILFVPRKSSEINPNSPPILIVPFPTFPGKAIHSGSQSEAGRRSLLMLFLVILRLVDIFPTI